MNFNISYNVQVSEVEVDWKDSMAAQVDDQIAFKRNCHNLLLGYDAMHERGVFESLASLNSLVAKAPAYKEVLVKAYRISKKRFPNKKERLEEIASCI